MIAICNISILCVLVAANEVPQLFASPMVTRAVPLTSDQWGVTLRHRPTYPLVQSDRITFTHDAHGLRVAKALGEPTTIHLVLLRQLEVDFSVRVQVLAPPRGGGRGLGGTAIPYFGFRSHDGLYEAYNHAPLSGANEEAVVFEIRRSGEQVRCIVNGRDAAHNIPSDDGSGYFFIHMNDQAQIWIQEIEVTVFDGKLADDSQRLSHRCRRAEHHCLLRPILQRLFCRPDRRR